MSGGACTTRTLFRLSKQRAADTTYGMMHRKNQDDSSQMQCTCTQHAHACKHSPARSPQPATVHHTVSWFLCWACMPLLDRYAWASLSSSFARFSHASGSGWTNTQAHPLTTCLWDMYDRQYGTRVHVGRAACMIP